MWSRHGRVFHCYRCGKAQSCPTLCSPMGCTEFSRPEYWSRYHFPSPGDLANSGIEPRSPTLQADSLLAEPQGKPKNTGMGSLSLLQRIFLTQESNQGLLYCRWLLYQLSYPRSPQMWKLRLKVMKVRDIGTPMADSCCCLAATNTIL